VSKLLAYTAQDVLLVDQSALSGHVLCCLLIGVLCGHICRNNVVVSRPDYDAYGLPWHRSGHCRSSEGCGRGAAKWTTSPSWSGSCSKGTDSRRRRSRQPPAERPLSPAQAGAELHRPPTPRDHAHPRAWRRRCWPTGMTANAGSAGSVGHSTVAE